MNPESEPDDAVIVRPTHDVEPPPDSPARTALEMRVVEVNEALIPAYQKASTLELTDAEIAALTEPFPDEAVEIRPHDGLVYIPHILISDRLNKVFRPGKWALVCRRHWIEGNTMYGEYIILVRGCFVGESIGGHPYQPNNPKVNYSDTLESTAAEALRRIAGKRLSCGSQVWNPEYSRQWCAKYAELYGTKWRKKQFSGGGTESKSVQQPATPVPSPAAAPEKPKTATEKTKAWFLGNLLPAREMATRYCIDVGILLPNETLEDIPLDRVPTTVPEMDGWLVAISKYADTGIAEKPAARNPPQPTPKPPPENDNVPEGNAVEGMVEAFAHKDGQSKKGPWTRYSIKVGDAWYSSFDSKIGDKCKALKDKMAVVRFEATEKGNNIISIDAK